MSKFIISPVTTWDDENQLWETKVGLDGKDMPLLYSVWHKEESRSRLRAMELVECLQIGNAQPGRVTVGRDMAYRTESDLRMRLEVERQMRDEWRPVFDTNAIEDRISEISQAKGGTHE